MPTRLTETAILARQHGITYACAKYRLAHGIPLDKPAKHGNPKKAWDTRGRKYVELERRTGLSRNAIKYRLARGIPLDAPPVSREEALQRANRARLAKAAAGELKPRKYRVDPDRIERPMQLRIVAGKAVNPWAAR